LNDLIALLNRYAPEYGVPEGDERQWRSYVEQLSRFKVGTLELAMEAWRRGEFDKRNKNLGMIFPTAAQLGLMAVKIAPHMDAQPSHAAYFKALLQPIPDHLKPALTPQQVAERLRGMAEVDEDVVL